MKATEKCFANEQELKDGIVTEFIVKDGFEKKLKDQTNAYFSEEFLYAQAKQADAILWEEKKKK